MNPPSTCPGCGKPVVILTEKYAARPAAVAICEACHWHEPVGAPDPKVWVGTPFRPGATR